MAYSPADMEWEEANYGYTHIKDGAYCGELLPDNLLTADAGDAEQCAALASGAGAHSFILGTSFARGKCYKGTMEVDDALYAKWHEKDQRVSPDCDVGDGWKQSTLFDFYAG